MLPMSDVVAAGSDQEEAVVGGAFWDEHRSTLQKAVETIASREYWSPFPESPRAYGEDAPTDGEAAFQARLGAPFPIDQPSRGFMTVAETSPYGTDLGVSYPKSSVDDLVVAATAAMGEWVAVGPDTRAGVCIEILQRLSVASFEMAHAVMQTTGQAFLMAFQAGGPHALDRGLEAIAYAHREMTRLPKATRWEKPQGKRDPIVVDKTWRIRPRGVAAAIGVSTFPTWNGYPGIFASLVTGNPVIVKPHPATILPFAMFVETARAAISDAGFDPNLVTLLVDTPDAPVAKELVQRPEVQIVDYTGGSSFGEWLETNLPAKQVFTEKSGVNSVIVDSAEDLRGVFRNLSVSMSIYSGQMCTTPQNVYVPRDGITVGEDTVDFDDVAGGLAAAIEGLLIDAAAEIGDVVLASREVRSESFADAVMRTPVVVSTDSTDGDAYMQELFGPVVVIVATDSTEQSIELAGRSARQKGALTWLVYTTSEDVAAAAEDAAVDAGVSISFNLTGGLFVNQSAAYSDFHATGANPAGNSALTDPAFVASRFRVVGVRRPV
jgi:acyl-CoA reductase-like NAD-dependent aldehyde dehydrogenase